MPRYCNPLKVNGQPVIICGKKRIKACVKCGTIAPLLCDYPVVKGVTCDVPICEACALEIGPDRHLCPAHAERYAGPQQKLSLQGVNDDDDPAQH